MKRYMTNLPGLTVAISVVLFALVALAPPKASAGIEIFFTIDGINGSASPVHQISTSDEIYNVIMTIASTIVL